MRKCKVDKVENDLYLFLMLCEGIFLCSGIVSRTNVEWPKYLTRKAVGRVLIEEVKCLPNTFRSKVYKAKFTASTFGEFS